MLSLRMNSLHAEYNVFFSCFCCCLLTFFEINFFKHYGMLNVQQFGNWILFATVVISRQGKNISKEPSH